MLISGKVALVTGGASGIGAALAAALLRAGARVAVADMDQAALDRATDGLAPLGEVLPVRLDVADRAAWQEAAAQVRARFGGAQILFNNAGLTIRRAPVGALAPEAWDRLIGVNLTGVFNGSHAFLNELLGPNEPGHIVNTASICGLLSSPGIGAYVASKYAVLGLSETMRFELAERNVGVTALCPGFVATNLIRNSPPAANETEAERAARAARLDGAMPPDRVATAVLDAIAGNKPYVFTHPEYGPAVRSRFAAIQAALDGGPANPAPEDTAPLAAWWLARDAAPGRS